MTELKDEPYKAHYPENSRHLEKGTAEIIYRPWNDFDIKEVWAESPHPLKGVQLGYGFYGDFELYGDKYVKKSYSVSTSVTENVSKDGIKITILSYEEAVKKSKEIDWSKVKIER